jgi:hypothetical protein
MDAMVCVHAGGGQQVSSGVKQNATSLTNAGSLVCLHCRAEAEVWMTENPPEAYLSKPWPALQYTPHTLAISTAFIL